MGRASDIWSLGCILYQLVYNHTPFAHVPMHLKVEHIINPAYKINFPDIQNQWLLHCMQTCLERDPLKRLSIPELLEHPFLRPDREQWSSGPGPGPGRSLVMPSSSAECIMEMMPYILSGQPLPRTLLQKGTSEKEVSQIEEELRKAYSRLKDRMPPMSASLPQ